MCLTVTCDIASHVTDRNSYFPIALLCDWASRDITSHVTQRHIPHCVTKRHGLEWCINARSVLLQRNTCSNAHKEDSAVYCSFWYIHWADIKAPRFRHCEQEFLTCDKQKRPRLLGVLCSGSYSYDVRILQIVASRRHIALIICFRSDSFKSSLHCASKSIRCTISSFIRASDCPPIPFVFAFMLITFPYATDTLMSNALHVISIV